MTNERLVHRLEAFSDIVMGFVLAQMAITLAVPKSVPTTNDLLENLIAFAATFGLIAIVWTLHTRLFAIYFVPNAVMMVANFTMLGALVANGYIFALTMHFANQRGDAPLFAAWFCCFALVYMLLAAMYGIGTYLRRGELTPREFSSGIERVVTATIGSAALVLVGVLFPRFNHAHQANSLLPYVVPFAALALVARLVIRRRFVSSKA